MRTMRTVQQAHPTALPDQRAAHETTVNPPGILLDQRVAHGIKNAVTSKVTTTLVTFVHTTMTTTQHEVTHATGTATTIPPKAGSQRSIR